MARKKLYSEVNDEKYTSSRISTKRQKYPKVSPGIKLNVFIKPKNYTQELLLESLNESILTICSGPAGTGKTYLAVYVALQKLLNNEIGKIVLTRPVVEAGENLGALPGGFEEKLHPYLLPLLDSLEEFVGVTMTKNLLENGKIEIAPLAYMRGRSFKNSYVILDECQNATQTQVKMFLTRIGSDSFFSINGDSSQSDIKLHNQTENGLEWAARKLVGADPSITCIEFTLADSVRHPLIRTILTRLESPDPIRRRAPS